MVNLYKRIAMKPEHSKLAEAFIKHIGAVIKKQRTLKGIKQSAIAKQLNCTTASISRYESGKYDIQASTMADISTACGFSLIEYCLFDDPETSLSDKYRYLIRASEPDMINALRGLERASKVDIEPNIYQDIYQYRVDSGSGLPEHKSDHKKSKDLFDVPPNYDIPPFTDEDDMMFEKHMYEPYMSRKKRILLYGYELLKLYNETNTPRNSTRALSRNILKKLIKTSSAKDAVDYLLYDYYWAYRNR